MSYSAFLAVVDAWAPIEGRGKVPREGRGRPMLAFYGITCRRLPAGGN